MKHCPPEYQVNEGLKKKTLLKLDDSTVLAFKISWILGQAVAITIV